MKFNVQFSERIKSVYSRNNGDKHPLFVDERPLSVSEMYRRTLLGIPLSCPKPLCDRINLNGNFNTDMFDVLDTALANEVRISAENKQKDLLEQRKLDEERRLFKEWKDSLKTSIPSSNGGTTANGATEGTIST